MEEKSRGIPLPGWTNYNSVMPCAQTIKITEYTGYNDQISNTYRL